MMNYKVYVIDANAHYGGKSLVAAETAEEANEFIRDFVHRDPRNHCDSRGYGYVYEGDAIESVYAEEKGIVYYGIYYTG